MDVHSGSSGRARHDRRCSHAHSDDSSMQNSTLRRKSTLLTAAVLANFRRLPTASTRAVAEWHFGSQARPSSCPQSRPSEVSRLEIRELASAGIAATRRTRSTTKGFCRKGLLRSAFRNRFAAFSLPINMIVACARKAIRAHTSHKQVTTTNSQDIHTSINI